MERKFKVGDRVRVLVKTGLRMYDVGTTCEVVDVYDDGVLLNSNGRGNLFYDFCDLEPIAVADSNSNNNTLRIEAGRYYKTRDGRKVGPMERDRKAWTPNNGSHWYNSDGTRYFGEDDGTVIVAEWTEPKRYSSCAAAQVDVQREEYGAAVAKPKFKVGDRVETDGGFTFDPNQGVIVAVDHADPDLYTVSGIDHPDTAPEEKWYYRTRQLRLVAPATSGKRETLGDILSAALARNHAIVCRHDNGQPRPAPRPYVHPNREAATAEAARLARTNPGVDFGVYELVDTKREAKVYDHEWQRLAAKGERIRAVKELRRLAGVSLKAAVNAVDYVKDAA